MLWVLISISARCTTLCDKVCYWLATGWWFSPSPQVSSTNKTGRHNINEILLKVALNTINQPKPTCVCTVLCQINLSKNLYHINCSMFASILFVYLHEYYINCLCSPIMVARTTPIWYFHSIHSEDGSYEFIICQIIFCIIPP